MMNDIYYVNNDGERLCLTQPPYRLNPENIMDFEWSYNTRAQGLGEKAVGFFKTLKDDELELAIVERSFDARNAAADRFNDVTELDVVAGIPGKLYVGDWYTSVYIIGAETTGWHRDVGAMVKTIKPLFEGHSWIKEIRRDFFVNADMDDDTETDDQHAKDWEYDYEYDYMLDKNREGYVQNDAMFPCGWEVIINGMAAHPTITIGDNLCISMNLVVADGEYLTINSIDKTIILTDATGETFNRFGYRDQGEEYGYIFEAIDPGMNRVGWNGAYSWTLTLFDERSEPRWTEQAY